MILIGNAFPLTLIRRGVRIEPATWEELRERAAAVGWLSFWGHDNTRAAVAEHLGFDPVPHTARPALGLAENMLPTLAGHVFSEVWILSPNYIENFRPSIGVEITPEKIASWQVLRLSFLPMI